MHAATAGIVTPRIAPETVREIAKKRKRKCRKAGPARVIVHVHVHVHMPVVQYVPAPSAKEDALSFEDNLYALHYSRPRPSRELACVIRSRRSTNRADKVD